MSFSGIFVKLSKEWDPPVWLVSSSNVFLQPVLCHFSFSIFFSFTQSSPSLFCVASERKRARPEIGSFAGNRGFLETTSDLAQAGSWDTQTSRSKASPTTGDSRPNAFYLPKWWDLMLSSLFSFFFSFLSFFLLHSGFFSFSSSRSDGCNAVRASAFFFFSSSSSIKHIWLRAVGGFGFLIHWDF